MEAPKLLKRIGCSFGEDAHIGDIHRSALPKGHNPRITIRSIDLTRGPFTARNFYGVRPSRDIGERSASSSVFYFRVDETDPTGSLWHYSFSFLASLTSSMASASRRTLVPGLETSNSISFP